MIIVSTSCKNGNINRGTYISKEEQTSNNVSQYKIIKDKFVLNTTNMEMHIEYPSILRCQTLKSRNGLIN